MRDHHPDFELAAALDRDVRPATTTVADVMVRHPKTLPAAASVGEAATAFEDDHVHLVLLVDGVTLVGTVTRGDLPAVATEVGGEAVGFATLAGRTVAPTTDAREAAALMSSTGSRRLAVVDSEQRLLGLLCLKRSGRGFCSDGDVTSRALPGSSLASC